MAFFHQLRLLLWKNGLGVIRRPGWSLTVILWPIIIFIILAITRQQFPPILREPCYVNPRNLPSAGFFPFLQTLMCNTDSTCHNKSRLPTSDTSRSIKRLHPKTPPLTQILQSAGVLRSALFHSNTREPAELLKLLDGILRSTREGPQSEDSQQPNNVFLVAAFNSTLSDQEEALDALKKSLCTVVLSMMNTSSSPTLTYALGTFCKSNNTLLEVSLLTLNKMLTELMANDPSIAMTMAGQVVVIFDRLQNQSALWDSLLAIPQLFSATSVDQALAEAEALLTNVQGFLQGAFPEAGATLSSLHPLLDGGVTLLHYVQRWPGKDVYITLGDIVVLQNDTLSDVIRQVLQEIRIPLDKAIGLLHDRDTVHSYICQSSSHIGLTTACTTGMVDMLLNWISPEKVAKQALLMWSQEVAQSDIAFVQSLLHSLMGGAQAGSNIRTRRSVDIVDIVDIIDIVDSVEEQPQNIEEELFLSVGRVVLDGLTSIPGADMVVQNILHRSFSLMQTANLAINTMEEMIGNVLKDAAQLQSTYVMLMTNQPGASVWIGRLMDSVIEMLMETVTQTGPSTCQSLVSPFEWLLSSESVELDTWRAMICQNITNLQQSLAMDWWPLVHMVEQVYMNISSQQSSNVTLPMILSEWHQLYNNTLHVGSLMEEVASELGTDYWMSWMPVNNNTYDVTETLLQSFLLAVAKLSKEIEQSELWAPKASSYLYMVSWVVNYRPGNDTKPANCSVDANTLALHCSGELNWPQFVQETAQAMMSLPYKPDILISCLQGAVCLLQDIYGDVLKHQMASYIHQGIPEGDALSAYMMDVIHHLDGLARQLTSLDDGSISSPELMLPHVFMLLQSAGLTPLMPLFHTNASLSAAAVLDAAVQLGRQQQHLFTFDETDPTLPDLERLMVQLLSTEGNLTLPLSLGMAHTVLTYSGHLRPEDIARLQATIRPYTNQTSAGFAEAVLSAMELLKELLDAPDGNPTHIVLAYLQQLQEFLVSALRLRRIDQVWLPSGQLSTAQVTDLHLVTVDLLQLISPQGLQNLTQSGPNVTQQIIIAKLLAFLPLNVQLLANDLLQDVLVLENQMSFCTSTGHNCVVSVSEILSFFQQVATLALESKGNVTVQITPTNPFLQSQESLHMTATLFSLFLPQRDAAYVRLLNQTLHFIKSLMTTPDPSVAQVQDALRDSNLTLAELDHIAALLGANDINDLLVTIVGLIDVRQCFEPQPGPGVTVQCAMGLIRGISGFLSQLPTLHNESAFLALVPTVLDKTALDVQRLNFSGDAQLPVVQLLNSTLSNIKMSFALMNLNSTEVMDEIRVLEGLLGLASVQPFSMPPLSNINGSMAADPVYPLDIHLEIAQWYLKKLEMVTGNSSFSSLLYPIYRMAELQLGIQLASANISLFVSSEVTNLMNSLQYPISTNGRGVLQIGLTAIDILGEEIRVIMKNVELHNDYSQSLGAEPFFNSTTLSTISYQTERYLDLIRDWMRKPNVISAFDSMLQWGNSTLNISTPGKDLHQLLQTVAHFLSEEQRAYLSAISDITQAINQALAVAERAGGLQSEHFSDAILEVVRGVMQSLTAVTGPLPLALQHNVLAITQDLLRLMVKPNMSSVSVRNISLHILKRAEAVVNLTMPNVVVKYLMSGIQIMTMYFETVSLPDGPDKWNEIILNVMKAIWSVLPQNSTAEAYINTVFDITHSELQSNQDVGNISLPMVFSQMQMILSSLWPVIPGDLGLPSTVPSLMGLVDLAPVLEEIMTGNANPGTWHRLEMILNTVLLLVPRETPVRDDLVALVIEKCVDSVVENIQAQNALLLSLQRPVLTLIADITQAINSSGFNLSVIPEKLLLAIERTVMMARQANGTLECHTVLVAWEPMREAVGMSQDALGSWCNISLQPVIQSYMETIYANLNISHAGPMPGGANGTAASITTSLQTLYHALISSSHVTEQLIWALSMKVCNVTLQPLSPQAQAQWEQQLQDMQLQHSLDSLQMLSDLLSTETSVPQSYVDAVESAAGHLLGNVQAIHDGDSAQHVFTETANIFLHSLNLTADSVLVSALDGTSLHQLMKEVVTLITQVKVFGEMPEVYHLMELFMGANGTRLLAEEVAGMLAWASSAQATGTHLLPQVLPRAREVFRALLCVLDQMGVVLPENTELFGDLVWNLGHMLGQVASDGDLPTPMEHNSRGPRWGLTEWVHPHNDTRAKSRRRRDTLREPLRGPVDNFLELFFIDYPGLFRAVSVPPSTSELLETAHVFFANPDLSVVMKGVTGDMPWVLGSSREGVIDDTLGALSHLTHPGLYSSPWTSMDLLINMADVLPEGLPYSQLIKNIAKSLARESQENMALLWQAFQTGSELLNTSMEDEHFAVILSHLTSQVCSLENMDAVRQLMAAVNTDPGQLCQTLLPALRILTMSLPKNDSSLQEALFQTFIGEPFSYHINSDWTSVFIKGLGLNVSSFRNLNINMPKPATVKVGEMLKNKTAFVMEVQRSFSSRMSFNPQALHLLLNTTLPNNNLEILSWLLRLRHCSEPPYPAGNHTEAIVFTTFCSMSAQQWYIFSLLMVRHVNPEKFFYRVVMSEDLQGVVEVVVQMTTFLTDMMDKLAPVMDLVHGFLFSVKDLNLASYSEDHSMVRGYKMSGGSMLTTMSRAICRNGVMALFGISRLTTASQWEPSAPDGQEREDTITKFKIPRNSTPFCMKLYLDMVNTTGGAIAWAFLKPMLMGQILFTPNTPATRAIMEKSNYTLQEFANLKNYSQDWIDSSNYIMMSAKLLSDNLPILQNSLGNAFVKNFIEMQTDINVGDLKETLSSFSNMTVMLEKNKRVLKQITALSNLMVNISSCIKYDRYRGYDSAEEMNIVAQELAKNRDLYASVIFKLPNDVGGARNHTSSAPVLPRKVRYTIRMHMDNVMRTDRVRTSFFVKDRHISAQETLRYTRGFIYLQESIDRAIIATQVGGRVTEPAVQLQPFPYPCFLRDEYLEAISFVFPLMLMIAWILFVADFVKKLVHERELRLHEYMKMMGVHPLSHFCAWFLECAGHLVLTIVILTLVLKYGGVLPKSDGFLLFLFFCDYGLSVVAISYLVSSFFDQTYIAGLSGSLAYVLSFFPFIIVMGLESSLSSSQKSALGLLAPTCFSYASQYVSRYEAQGEGIQWSNSYTSPVAQDTCSFGWMCWLLVIDSALYFLVGAYVRMVFPGKYGIPAPWYFPLTPSFWARLCCEGPGQDGGGLLFTNIMQSNQPVFSEDKGKGQNVFAPPPDEEFSGLPVGVVLHGLTKTYGERVALSDLNVSFYEGHVTSLLGHNGAGKTTTMSLLTGLFAPSAGTIEVYGRDMAANMHSVRRDLGVCMQYDVLFDHMTTKEHLLLYGQIKAPQWTRGQLHEQVGTILEETGMYAHRHKRVGTLSGGMKRKLSISIAFIGGSRLVVLDEPTTGVDPCSRRSIWDIVNQRKSNRTIIMSTHHLDEAEVLSDRIAFLENGGLKCCGSPLQLKDKLGQGYKLTLTRKVQVPDSVHSIDSAGLKAFIQAHVPEARLKEAQGNDLVYTLPPFSSSTASSYRSLLSALDANLDALQLGCYGISHTTLEEVFLQLTQDTPHPGTGEAPLSISETVSDTTSMDSFSEDPQGILPNLGDKIQLTGYPRVRGAALVWQQVWAMLLKRFHHSRRDWKGLLTQVMLPVLFVVFAMGLGSIKSDLQHYPEMQLSPALYNLGPSYSFFSNRNSNSSRLVDTMLSSPGIDNGCLDGPDNPGCSSRSSQSDRWQGREERPQPFNACKCTPREQVCSVNRYQPPRVKAPSSQIVYNLSGLNVENYLMATANEYVRNRYGGFDIGQPIPASLQMDLREVPANRTLAKVWYNPEGHHTMPAYLNSLNNLILRSSLPADGDQQQYAIFISSHPYFGRADDEDSVVQGMIQILVAMCVLTGYAITTASFAIYEVYEHHNGAKRLQHIAGVGEPLYWIVNFIYDMLLYLVPVALTVAVIAAFQIPAFTDRQNLAAVTLLLVLFGFSTFPWMYLLAGVFKDAETAFITYVCINLFISINTIMPTSIVYFIGQLSRKENEAIHMLFQRLSRDLLIFPQFSFGNGLLELARVNMEVQLLGGYGVDAYKNPFHADALGWMFMASLLQGAVFFSLRLLLNRWLVRKVRRLIAGSKAPAQVVASDQDEDVAAEHQRVSSGDAVSDILQVNSLTKIYQYLNKKVHAVNRVSVGIPAGECFGLLGENGAGKTTTFKMLTGDISPTDGTAQIRDVDGRMVDIMECRDQGINIGYCPQVDALDYLLTGKEHLYFYARIRGISKREVDGVVNYLLKKLALVYHRDDVIDSYSCGTRRKLSTAMALIGRPQILLLDEPSSGMDPRTKRHLWKIISEEVKGKCAVVLTSHSMEECEALCSRLAIMVKGQFQCLGSLQHIKNRFGSGFTVKMYVSQAGCDVETITGFMQDHFPTTYLREQHLTMVEYHVPVAPGGVADIFHQLESNKKALQIKHFSVSQTTLDEVFINFAMGKIGTETVPIQGDHSSLHSIEAVQK